MPKRGFRGPSKRTETAAPHRGAVRRPGVLARRPSDIGTTVDIGPDAVLCVAGDRVWEAFVLLEGNAVALGADRPVAQFGAGDAVGWPEICTFGEAPATIVTTSAARVLVLSRREASAWFEPTERIRP